MARPSEFDQDAALDAAMRLFWREGYRGTSIQMLVEATGLNRSSLYNSFGNKGALFLRAMERYLAEVNRARLTRMKSNSSARAGIQTYFEEVIEFATGDGRHLGCLLTNSAVELGQGDEDVRLRLFGVFQNVEDEFTRIIERGQREGDIVSLDESRVTARFLVTQLQGLRVMSRVNPDESWLRSALVLAMGVLDNRARVA